MKKFLACLTLLLAGSANAAMITSTGDAALAGATIESFDSVANGDYAVLTLPGVTIVGNGAPMTVSGEWTSDYGIGGKTLHNSASSPLSFELLFDATQRLRTDSAAGGGAVRPISMGYLSTALMQMRCAGSSITTARTLMRPTCAFMASRHSHLRHSRVSALHRGAKRLDATSMICTLVASQSTDVPEPVQLAENPVLALSRAVIATIRS